LLLDVGTGSEVDRPQEVVQRIVSEIGTPITLEQGHFRETGFPDDVPDFGNIRFVDTVRAVFVFYLYHEDVAPPGDLQIGQLFAHFQHKQASTFHEIGMVSSQIHTFILEQPPGQATHLPLRTNVGTRTYNDIQAVFLSQAHEGSNVLLAFKIVHTGLLFVVVPKHIHTDGIHT